MASKSTVSVIGLGYVGLSTGVCFASRGFKVIGVDADKSRIAELKNGRAPFKEEGLPELLEKGIHTGDLNFTSDYRSALHQSDVAFITTGTPSRNDGSIDLIHVKAVSVSLGKALRKEERYKLIVVKSSVVPGTTDGLVRPVLERISGKKLGEFGLAANPEFLREGSAIADTLSPDRIVIGSVDPPSCKMLEAFYSRFYEGSMPFVLSTNPVTAEMIKYASNAFLATKVSFINEIANLCGVTPGADVTAVARGIGLDRRIGPQFLDAGLGYGGSCLPKDVRALIVAAKAAGVRLNMLEAAEDQNFSRPLVVVKLAMMHCGDLKGKRVALLGVAFKPGTDDVREAVSIRLAEEFLKRGSKVVVYDPVAIPNFKSILGRKCEYADSALSCINDADCCILVTEWNEFRRMRPQDFMGMRNPFLIDGRRIYDPSRFMPTVKFAAVGLGNHPYSDSFGQLAR